jgi:RNA polymerase primary sigma factor
MRPLNQFLKMAVLAGVESAIQIHIERGDDLNARDGNGLTLLMLSAARNKSAMCRLLLNAGADKSLLAPSGKTALAIAVAVGAHDAATVLETNIVAIENSDALDPKIALPAVVPITPLDNQALERHRYIIDVNAAESKIVLPMIQINVEETIDPSDTSDFDLLDWEPEEENGPPPEIDLSVAQAANAIQTAISGYEPIDSSEDWGDIDAYLPERSLPLVRTDDAEARERLHLLLLRAIREGSVPSMEVESLSLNDDRSANLEAEALLIMVVNDLGAEVDERFEYISTNENFEVFVSPEETQDEEEIVADAMTFVDSLASRRTEPLRIYQKEFQRERLISAEEEVSISQAMEIGIERALDALAAWPRGINVTLAAGYLVKTRQRPLTWMLLGPVEAQPDLEPALECGSDAAVVITDQIVDEVDPNDDSLFDTRSPHNDDTSDFVDALDRLTSITRSPLKQKEASVIRETLKSLRLNRRFLLELAYTEEGDDSEVAIEYIKAMRGYQCARERMITANLKLVFHIAKKYQYSGEPLDDLAQEGNIGLLKAVERFDWRRGFKFSTYATWWIRQQIGRHIADKGRTIRIPVHIHDKVQRHSREVLAFESETGRKPELDEIAARLGMSARAITALQSISPDPLPIHDILIDEEIAVEVRSNFISSDPFDIVSEFELRRTIEQVLSTLKPKEEQILRLRYGIGINDALTLEDVGQRYELTRERIRQIEARAIQKLKQPSRMVALSSAFPGCTFPPEGKRAERDLEPENTAQSDEMPPIQHDVPNSTTVGHLSLPLSKKSSGIERLVAQAADLNIPVVDDRNGKSGKTWVIVIEASDVQTRRFIRKLLALGFEFWPGKGYWK